VSGGVEKSHVQFNHTLLKKREACTNAAIMAPIATAKATFVEGEPERNCNCRFRLWMRYLLKIQEIWNA